LVKIRNKEYNQPFEIRGDAEEKFAKWYVKNEMKKILVLCGGVGSEREISLMSGINVFENIPRRKYEPLLVEIDKKGEWKTAEVHQVHNVHKVYQVKKYLKGFDLVFIALHGRDGEDGRIQAFLDKAKIPYTFSGAKASRIAIDKWATNIIARKSGINVPKTIILDKSDSIDYQEIERTINYPCVVKPNSSGSSVATNIVDTRKNLQKATGEAFAEDDKILVQEYINGRELTCPVLGNSENLCKALPVLEIKSSQKFFDYNAKYKLSSTQEKEPRDLPQNIINTIKKQSITVHKALNCRGLTRSDFMLSKSNKIYFLEINTIPGLAPMSLCPKSAKLAGMNFEELLDKIVELALLIKGISV